MRCPSRDAERFAPRGSKRNVDVGSVGDVRDEASVVAMIGKSECNIGVFLQVFPREVSKARRSGSGALETEKKWFCLEFFWVAS